MLIVTQEKMRRSWKGNKPSNSKAVEKHLSVQAAREPSKRKVTKPHDPNFAYFERPTKKDKAAAKKQVPKEVNKDKSVSIKGMSEQRTNKSVSNKEIPEQRTNIDIFTTPILSAKTSSSSTSKHASPECLAAIQRIVSAQKKKRQALRDASQSQAAGPDDHPTAKTSSDHSSRMTNSEALRNIKKEIVGQKKNKASMKKKSRQQQPPKSNSNEEAEGNPVTDIVVQGANLEEEEEYFRVWNDTSDIDANGRLSKDERSESEGSEAEGGHNEGSDESDDELEQGSDHDSGDGSDGSEEEAPEQQNKKKGRGEAKIVENLSFHSRPRLFVIGANAFKSRPISPKIVGTIATLMKRRGNGPYPTYGAFSTETKEEILRAFLVSIRHRTQATTIHQGSK